MYVSQESFLRKSVRKSCLEPRAFVYSLTRLPFSFRVSIYERLSTHNSARTLKVERNCIQVRGMVNRSPVNRGSTVVASWVQTHITYNTAEYEILSSHSGVDEDSGLLGHDTWATGKYFQHLSSWLILWKDGGREHLRSANSYLLIKILSHVRSLEFVTANYV
jgi:hypothetical protein